MTNKSFIQHLFYAMFFVIFVSSCGSSNVKDQDSKVGTLADIDVSQRTQDKKTTKKVSKSQEEIRNAYRRYVDSASSSDLSRQNALTRLAQLELELSNSLVKDSEHVDHNALEVNQSLNRTISLLETTLKDYPKAKGNDKVLYQLAQAYDRAGQYDKSIATLDRLANDYRLSLYYPEAQFRLAESAFARGDYITAEDAYTEVILTPGSDKYYEKSLFKRGWTRYKQQVYQEAIDDYIEAIDYHQFGPKHSLNDSSKTQFDEYLRALGLAFSYEGTPGNMKVYFEQRKGFKYIYDTYSVVSDIFIAQERYSDAATILVEYTGFNQFSPNNIDAELKIIESWKQGGFTSKLFQSIEGFYRNYQPASPYWQRVSDNESQRKATDNLRSYITQISAYHHERYSAKKNKKDFSQAKLWYNRYLQHYSSYANKDNIYALFGELLLSANQKQNAFNYFAKAAFDGNIILDKKAAYSTIVLSDELLETTKNQADRTHWLDKQIAYAQQFTELYPKDKRSENIAARAAERAFKAARFQNVIDIVNNVPDSSSERTRFNTNNLKARSFLELKQFADAESVYISLMESGLRDRKSTAVIRDSLALSIYRQGESAKNAKQTDVALSHFTRIARYAPESELAATGFYDAMALSIENKLWNQAIGLGETFKRQYPRHKQTADVTRKLSVAYLNSDQKGKAAKEFERIAKFEGDIEVKMAALWQAAELYESKNQISASIRAYRDYANTYKTPYEPNMEAMYKLTELYQKAGDKQKKYFWQNKIRKSDQNATKRIKTDRTTFIASSTTLDLARQKKSEFDRQKLIAPIEKNLKLKKSAMQESVKLFGQASSYGIQSITTEATFSIGQIYLDFSESLLSSERPKNLNSEELEQYEILLEDQAFPFEEKAIEFYETNLSRSQDNVFDTWSERSFNQLTNLFPVRYKRVGKVSAYEPN